MSRTPSSRILTAITAALAFASLAIAGCGAASETATGVGSQGEVPTPAVEPSPTVGNEVNLPDMPAESPAGGGIQRAIEVDTIIPSRPRVDVTTYTVQAGDNLFLIAEQYGLKPETILWGNYDVLRDNPQFLRPDQELNILPIDGTYYQWVQGDTLEGVADFFGVSPGAVTAFLP